MRPVLLIAANYLREQRWLVVVLLAWVFGSSLVLGLDGNSGSEDAAFFLHQQAAYGVAFATFLAASAIQTERRSRRILSVLSKAIERRQYLAGLLLGIGAVEGIYVLSMAIGALWVLPESGVSLSAITYSLPLVLLSALLAAAVALFFATFLHPLFALVATAISVAVSATVALTLAQPDFPVVPVYALLAYVMRESLTASRPPDAVLCGVAVLQVFLFWLAAAKVFSYRDIAAAIE
jgi:ABC-type transport system involved in multi-copper enzyme maturation permease subunit